MGGYVSKQAPTIKWSDCIQRKTKGTELEPKAPTHEQLTDFFMWFRANGQRYAEFDYTIKQMIDNYLSMLNK